MLAHASKTRTVIVCNGYKDRKYNRLALISEKLGHKIYLVIEKMTEVRLVLEETECLNVVPHLSIRACLASVRLRQMAVERQREIQVRPSVVAGAEAGRDYTRRGPSRQPAAAALPPRIADGQHSQHRHRCARVGVFLHRAGEAGRQH